MWVNQRNGSGLCRRCTRKSIAGQQRTLAREAERVARVQAAEAAKAARAIRIDPALLQPRPSKEIAINGQGYEVVWDGA